MKNLVRGFFLTLLFLLWQGSLSAGDNIPVDARLVNESALDIFFLKDFDINSTSSGPPIFFVDIRNNSQQACEIILRLSIVTQTQGVLGEGETGPFTLGANELLMLSNNNLFSSTDPHRLVTFEINEDAAQSLLDAILVTGKLPTNTYLFNFVARNVDNQTPPVQDNVVIEVTNQVMPPDLIGPGGPVSGGIDESYVIYTPLPQFRWETNLGTCRVIIAEAFARGRPGKLFKSRTEIHPNLPHSDQPGLPAADATVTSWGAGFAHWFE